MHTYFTMSVDRLTTTTITMSSVYAGNFDTLAIILGDGGPTYTYLDSGVPPLTPSLYTTIIAVHGLAYNAREPSPLQPCKVASSNIHHIHQISSEESFLSHLTTEFGWLLSTVADMEVQPPIRRARP